MELLETTVAKNVDIVWERINAILLMEAAKTGARQDTKEKHAKRVRAFSIISCKVQVDVTKN